MASTSDFRTGLILIIDNDLFSIVEFQHVKMGRGGAFVRTKLKNVKTGRVVEKTFRGGEKVQDARVERRPMQFLYKEGEYFVLMDSESYEQMSIPQDLIQSGSEFLKESEIVGVLMHGDTPIGVEMPNFVNLQITSTEPGLKGDTVSGSTKPAVLETGGVVQVPLFIEEGEIIRVDTRTSTYIERVKE